MSRYEPVISYYSLGGEGGEQPRRNQRWGRGPACGAPHTQSAWLEGGMSGDVLSQQTHRTALVGVPWQLAAAGALGRECPGLAASHHLAGGHPAGRRAPGAGGDHSHRRPSPSPASPSCFPSGGLGTAPRAHVPGGIVGPDGPGTLTLGRTRGPARGGDRGSESFLEGGGALGDSSSPPLQEYRKNSRHSFGSEKACEPGSGPGPHCLPSLYFFSLLSLTGGYFFH